MASETTTNVQVILDDNGVTYTIKTYVYSDEERRVEVTSDDSEDK